MMKKLFVILLTATLLTGCSDRKKVEALKTAETKEEEKAKEKQLDKVKEKYLDELRNEMANIEELIEETSEIAKDNDTLVIAAKIHIGLELPIESIELLIPPKDLKGKHDEILTNLRTSKVLANNAIDLYMNKEFDEGNENMKRSGESLGRAQRIYSDLVDGGEQ